MKHYYLLLLIIVTACNNHNRNSTLLKEDIEEDSISLCYNPILGREIKKFIDYNDSLDNTRSKNKKNIIPIVYDIMFNTFKGSCYIILGKNFFYDKEQAKNYFYYKNYLIIYNNSDTTCVQSFINEDKMIKFKDSIPGYKDVSESNMEYDTPLRVFKVINQDSLETIYTGIIWRPEEL